ncbi:hypothetical protein Scep_029748 [Stephania cephalantha]|uniref:Uncharacterized protein n=1 Tax=Stephania cephalantha TaxID=152367 RepID=A0AAP0HFX7_9MAGN
MSNSTREDLLAARRNQETPETIEQRNVRHQRYLQRYNSMEGTSTSNFVKHNTTASRFTHIRQQARSGSSEIECTNESKVFFQKKIIIIFSSINLNFFVYMYLYQ